MSRMKSYPHLRARIFGVPLLMDPAKIEVIVGSLATPLGVAPHAMLPLASTPDVPLPQAHLNPHVQGPLAWGPKATVAGSTRNDKPYLVTRSGVAVIVADGSLAHAAAGAYPDSGVTAYSDLCVQLSDAAADPMIRAILIDDNSPGGEASDSAFATAALIRRIRANKPVWAVADEMALSAGYLIGSAASRLTVPRLGYVGSIGVYALHLDRSGFDRNEGLAWTYIKAGARKTDGNPHEPLNDEYRAQLQRDVDLVYQRFIAEVAQNRPGLGSKGALDTEARYYIGSDGIAKGLADAAQSFDETLAELEALIARGNAASNSILMAAMAPLPVSSQAETPPSSSAASPASDAGDSTQPTAVAAADQSAQEHSMSETTQAAGQSADATTIVPSANQPAANQQTPEQHAAAARAYAAEVAELCNLAGMPGKAAEFIAANKPAAEVRSLLQAAKAASAAGTDIHTANAGQSKPAASNWGEVVASLPKPR